MNDITSNSVWIDRPITDKDGTTFPGFFAYFQKTGQSKPTNIQRWVLADKSEHGYVTFFGTVEETFYRISLYKR